MNKNKADKIDDILKITSEEMLDNIISQYPSVDGLADKYDFSKKHNKRMAKLFRRAELKEDNLDFDSWYKFRKFSYNAAALICIIFTLFVLLAFTVPPIRITITNYFVEYNEKYLELNTNIDETEEHVIGSPQYIPEGYIIKEVKETESSLKITYINDEAKEIRFMRYNGDVNVTIDNEDSEVKEININGFSGYSINKNDQIIILLYSETFTYQIIAELSYAEMMLVAESITEE